MNSPRSRARILIVALGLFVAAMAGALVVMYEADMREGVLTSRQLAAFRERLDANPSDEALKVEIRDFDAALRSRHEARRWRFEWARWLLLAALTGWIGALRWYFALENFPAAPEKQPLAGADARFRRGRRGALIASSGVGLAGLAALAALGLGARDTLPGPGAIRVAAPAPSASPEPVAAPSSYRGVWPCFRGPGNIGVAGEGDWPTTWSVATKHNVRWTVSVPLAGKSSPVVWHDRIFLTGADANQQRVMCFDRATGRMRWNALVTAPSVAVRKVEIFQDTGYAAPTATTDGERVYAVFPTGIVAAFDFEGHPVWQHDLGVPESIYSFASSPIVHDGLVFVQFDQGSEAEDELSELIAFDAATGRIRYGVPRSVVHSWSSPSIVEAGGRWMLVTVGNPWVIAYNPADGLEYWRVGGMSGDIAASPAFGGDMVFAGNDGAALLGIRAGGEDDVTDSEVAWRGYEGLPDTCSPVSDGKYVLLVAAGGGLSCYAADSGAVKWSEYLESGAAASPILAGGRVYLACDDGITRIFLLGDTFVRVGQGDIGEPVYATPAFVDNEIVIRGKSRLYCIGETK